MKDIVYEAGPTAAKFHADDSFVRGIIGPIGSGKSVAMVMEILHRAMRQRPAWDGIRRSRWLIVRNTRPELTSTTIATWKDWVKEEYYGSIVYSTPISHKLWLDDRTYLEVYFLALDDEQDVKKVLSLELTGAFINEAREIPRAIFDAVTGRVGRYPSKREGGASWFGVILDSNSFDDSHWLHDLIEDPPSGYRFWRQPSGLSAQAENLEHLPDQYYQRIAQGKSKLWVDIYIRNLYGTIIDGKPVYENDWRDDWHVSDVSLAPIKRGEILLGWDWGTTPACIIAQLTPYGQLRILDEVVGDNVAVERFVNDQVLPLLRTRYTGIPFTSIGDPAGTARTGTMKGTEEQTMFSILEDCGIPTEPAPSNEPTKRLEAVRWWLSQARGGQPGLLLDKRCQVLRKGFNGGYRFRKIQAGSGLTRYTERPEKNEFSHPHDALQYVCLHLREGQKAAEQPRIRHNPMVAVDAVAGF